MKGWRDRMRRREPVMIPAPNLPTQAEPGPEPCARDWRWQWRDAIRDPRELLSGLGLEELATRLSGPGAAQFPLRVPRAFAARMRRGDPADPLLRQVLPLLDEEQLSPGFGLDAVGDFAARGAAGVLHKYAGRALLIVTGSCAVHCRYCFRRHFPYAAENAGADRWAGAVEYLRADPSITEVLLSGGDPLSLSNERLHELGEALRRVPQLRRLRIHTRLPVVLPDRVDAGLCRWLGALPWSLAIILHANHANEFDADVDAACARLRASGASLLNQAVLLRGVNDSVDALAQLSERGFEAGVLPYYLHQLDRVQGAAHFEVPDATARQLHAALSARLPGYLVPRLVREIPGEAGKSPL
jgi:EF-P beta-lysylation protein EpmB